MADDQSTAISTEVHDAPGRSVLVTLAHKYGMEPTPFRSAVKSVCFGGKDVDAGQEAAFYLVCQEYGLNPVLKEIYAFPTRGGGIMPIVSVDGWSRMMNDHPAFDGIEFVAAEDDDGNMTAITAKIFRKDRGHPVSVTEYMEECKRNTDPWKQWPRRMLRHKAQIQAARIAFGFSGIMEPDEYERSRETITVDDDPAARLTQRLDAAASESAPDPVDDADVIDAEVEDVADDTTSTLSGEAKTQAAQQVAVKESAPANTGGLPFDDVPTHPTEVEAVAEVAAPTLVAFTELDDRDAVLKACEAYTENWIAARGQIASRSGPQMDAFIEATTADCQRVRDVSADLYAKIVEAM